MNGYTILKETYINGMGAGTISEEEGKQHIKIYEILEGLTREDLLIMVDSGAFNDIIRAYCIRTIKLAVVNAMDQACALRNLDFIFDRLTAGELLENLEK